MAGVPFVYTPLTRGTRYWLNTQNSRCYQYESDYIECAERVGVNKAPTACHYFLEDFIECVTGAKQKLRLEAMNRVRRYKKRPPIDGPPDDIVVVPSDLN